MPDNRTVQALDNAGKDREARRWGIIVSIDEDVHVRTFHPVRGRGVDGGLDISAVEVDGCAVGEIVEGTGEAEDVPEEGAGCGDLVDVEAGVYE